VHVHEESDIVKTQNVSKHGLKFNTKK